MSNPTSDHGPYLSQCHTCGEEQREVDLETAQDFFAIHADQRHEVEIVREDGPTPSQPTGAEQREPEEAAGTD